GVVTGHVHPLQHRRQDQRLLLGARGQVLIRGDPDGQRVRLDGRVEEARARCTRRVVDDLRAVVVHLGGERLALDRVVERAHVVADVLDEDLDVRGNGLRTGGVAGLELLDQRAGLPTEETDRVALALERRRGADQERALLLLEDEVGHVGRSVIVEPTRGAARGVPVHDHEAGVRVVRRDRVDVGRARERGVPWSARRAFYWGGKTRTRRRRSG